KSGDTKASLDTLKKLVDLDPDNVAARIRLGEQYARQDDLIEAVAELRRAAQYLQRNGRHDDYLRVAERISHLDQNDVGLAKEHARDDEEERAALKSAQSSESARPRAEPPGPAPPKPAPKPAAAPPPPVAKPISKPISAPIRVPPQRTPSAPIHGARPPSAPVAAAGAVSAPMTIAQVPKLLKETEVYVKYGLNDNALAHRRRG